VQQSKTKMMFQIPFSWLLKSKLKVFCILMTLVFTPPSVFSQVLTSLPDSVQRALATLPESKHDSIYKKLGAALYMETTFESHIKAIDCFKKALVLAEKYNHYPLFVDAHQCIGSVYDATDELPEKMLYYFKKAYDLSYKLHDSVRLMYAFDVAHAYGKLKDTVQCLYYLNIMKNLGNNLYEKGSENYDNLNLKLATMALKTQGVSTFIQLFKNVNQNRNYKDGRFPYHSYFVFNSSRYYSELGNYDKAIDILKNELTINREDSSYITDNIGMIYAQKGDFKEAYKWSEIHDDYKDRNKRTTQENELVIKLLKTESEFKEQEKLFKEKQNLYLTWGLFFAFIAMGVSAYFWRKNHIIKIELTKRNAEKELLVHEIHHRVKNNLQLMYSLATLQLPTISDEKAKDLWQKNLNQLKSMSLVNEKLYNTEGVTSFELKGFIQELVEHFKLLHGDYKNAIFDVQFKGDLNVNADFAVPFGLILSELITNSFKHAGENGSLPIHIFMERKDAKNLVFNYSDNGIVSDLSLVLDKKIGGVSLINDLVRQLEGKISMSNEKYLQYNFTFSI
jgi:two-component sensor histidine kinase